jgi:hypothetical protein
MRAGTDAIIGIAPASKVAKLLVASSAATQPPSEAQPAPADAATSALILASRLIAAQGGTIGVDDGVLAVRIGASS